MRKCLTKIFNIYFCDYTYKNLKYIINDPNIVLASSEKRVCISIINHKDCFLQKMTDSGIENIVHIATQPNMDPWKITSCSIVFYIVILKIKKDDVNIKIETTEARRH